MSIAFKSFKAYLKLYELTGKAFYLARAMGSLKHCLRLYKQHKNDRTITIISEVA
jgi:hypothetical protein